MLDIKLCIILGGFLLFTTASREHRVLSDTSNIWPIESTYENEHIEKRVKHHQGWSSWSDWSTCSRSCDGGIANQLRRCHAQNGCVGEPVRYKICNMQPCPDAQDFRAHQCAAYDDVPYDGALFKWTPHYDYADPCSLTCRGRPAHLVDEMEHQYDEFEDEPSVVVQLALRVQDGTRCRPGSLDMCIQGKCQRVGCDLRIGSAKKVDVCGICGGDGSSCSQPIYHWETAPMSLCSATCGGGYKMARPFCRNRVTGADVDESLCSAPTRPEPAIMECNTHACPARWMVEEWGPCSKVCNGGKRERLVYCTEELNGVQTKVHDKACKAMKPAHQEHCNGHECPKWTITEWSGCSVSCGTGIQIRMVDCDNRNEHSHLQCDPYTKPDTTQSCSTGITCTRNRFRGLNENVEHHRHHHNEKNTNHHNGYDDEEDDGDGAVEVEDDGDGTTLEVEEEEEEEDEDEEEFMFHDQPASGQTDSSYQSDESRSRYHIPNKTTFLKDKEWTPCSVTCGEGVQKKLYRCKIFLEFSRTLVTLNDTMCSGPKPMDEVQRCVMEPCSLAYSFEEPYPRDHHHYRQPNENFKVAAAVPGKTYSWREQGYTSCSASCLGGVEDLIINCVRDDTEKVVSPFLCSPETKPEARIRTCNDRPCPPRWNVSDYSACSKSCGIGIKTREVLCIHEVTRGGENTMIVPHNMCPQPPPADRQYCNVLDCPVKWDVSEWTKCSKTCGSGIKERKVACKQVMAQEHKVERPPSLCMSNSPKPPDKKPCNTKPCASENQRPVIAINNSTYIQHDETKTKVTLKIGGAATVFYGTQIKIKCPVKKFDRTKIRWSKDYKFLNKTRKYKVSKKGALRIINVVFKDSGLYTCHAGLSAADLRLTVVAKTGSPPNPLNEDYDQQHQHHHHHHHHHNNMDVPSDIDTFSDIAKTQDSDRTNLYNYANNSQSHDQTTSRSRQKSGKTKARLKSGEGGLNRKMETKEPSHFHSQMTMSEAEPTLTSSSSSSISSSSSSSGSSRISTFPFLNPLNLGLN